MKFLNLILVIIFTAVSSVQGVSYSLVDDSCLRPHATANAPKGHGMPSFPKPSTTGKSHTAVNHIKLAVAEDKEFMSRQAFHMLLADYYKAVAEKGYYVLGLATGSTPIRLYELLIDAAEQSLIDFSKIYTFNMDEYEGLDPEHTGDMTPQNPGDPNISYKAFMYRHLFGPLYARGLVTQEWLNTRVNIFDPNPEDAEEMCAAYERKISELGGVDTWVGGIGSDGHIAFNEPRGYRIENNEKVPVDSGTTPDSVSRRVQLVQSTIDDNCSFFEFIDREYPSKGRRWVKEKNGRLVFVQPYTAGAREITHDEALAMVPKTAFSIGIKTYKDAKHQIIMANGSGKAEAVRKGMEEAPDNNIALSLLQDCPNCDVIIDTQAATGAVSAQEIAHVKGTLKFSHSSAREIILAIKSAA